MFHKLKDKFEVPLYVVTDGLKTFTGFDGKGIDYKKIWSPEEEKIYKVLPKKYWKDFHMTVMTINCMIPPHTDTEIVTTINFYLQTEGCRTIFYDLKTDNPNKFQIKNQTNGFIFDKKDLTEVDSFVAEDFDIWVLDVTKIHSVVGDFNFRKAITLGTFVHKYEDVIEMLKENNSL